MASPRTQQGCLCKPFYRNANNLTFLRRNWGRSLPPQPVNADPLASTARRVTVPVRGYKLAQRSIASCLPLDFWSRQASCRSRQGRIRTSSFRLRGHRTFARAPRVAFAARAEAFRFWADLSVPSPHAAGLVPDAELVLTRIRPRTGPANSSIMPLKSG